MTKRIVFPKVMVIMMVLISLFTIMSVHASAATCSSGTRTQTITVSTKSNWWKPGSESITLSQTKGTRTSTSYNFWKKKTVTNEKKCYGYWDISYRSTDGKHSGKTKLTGSNVKIKLKANKEYKITISWNGQQDLLDSLGKGPFSQTPTWKVKSTYKVSSCY